jgi:hypothetical protein
MPSFTSLPSEVQLQIIELAMPPKYPQRFISKGDHTFKYEHYIQDELNQFRQLSRSLVVACPTVGDLILSLYDEQTDAIEESTDRFIQFLKAANGGSLRKYDHALIRGHYDAIRRLRSCSAGHVRLLRACNGDF